MKRFRWLTAILALLAVPAWAAPDANGYTAEYECRAGGPQCPVDVVALTTAACGTTITTADSLTTIQTALNSGTSPICITNGDYTSKGTITITGSGSAGNYRVMRYTRAGDNDDEPWNQGANQAKIANLAMSGADYWIVHRITISPSSGNAVAPNNGSDNNIFNRMLVNGGDASFWMDESPSNNGNTIQNSVVRATNMSAGNDHGCIRHGGVSNTHIVNNEIYNCAEHAIFSWNASIPGTVVENNDIYLDTDRYTNCSGSFNPSGTCGAAENMIGLKGTGSSVNPVRIIHNRIWGARFTDTSVCCNSGGSGQAILFQTNNDDYVLVQNNIIFDSQGGIDTYNDVGNTNYVSVVGNIFWKMQKYYSGWGTYGFLPDQDNYWEIYLNTLIDVGATSGQWTAGGFVNSDVRCNVMIESGPPTNYTQTGTQYNHNVYYSTANVGEANKIDKSVSTRANTTVYAAGAMIRISAPTVCTTATDPNCFLYENQASCATAGSAPTPGVVLGGSHTDGGCSLKAIYGPLTQRRKLRTIAGGEAFYIPYAVPHTSAPAAGFCPNTMANRTGIGVDDTQAGW